MKREINESFTDYKARRKNKGGALKKYLNGRVIWNCGTYVKKDEAARAIFSRVFLNRGE